VSYIYQLGERRVIEIMMRYLDLMPNMPIPFWDDVSAADLGGVRLGVLKTDMLVWSTDIPPGMTHYQAARKAVVMNISDLGAKGVRTTGVLVSLGLPRNTREEEAVELAKGMNAGAREYGAYILGGDTSETGEIIISGMAFGIGEKGKLMLRSGAMPGDILATTGVFGKTAAGFKILMEGLDAPDDLKRSLVDTVYMPRARVEEGVALAESGAVTASMDSSDGLAMSLYDLQRSSGMGFRVDRLPAAPEARMFAELHNLELSDLVFYGGEEYELVFTIKPERIEDAKQALRRVGGDLIEIGEVTEEKAIVYANRDRLEPIKAGGWEHFKSSP
jgi:thiamine-monophosphate kinase